MSTKTAPRAKQPPARRAQRAPIDPRVRQRWIATRRAQGRRRLRIVIAVGGVVAVLIVAYSVSVSPLFDIDRVVVYRIDDGKIAEIWVRDWDQYAYDELFADVAPTG